MRDIPVFTTQYGVASLILKEIPYSADAYIRLQNTIDPEKLLQECVSFCRAAGAERVYAAGHTYLENYPLHTAIFAMSCMKAMLPDTDAELIPVCEETLEQWRSLYNNKMNGIDNATYLSLADAQKILVAGEGYFIYQGTDLLGIGAVSKDTIRAVASLQAGAGADIVSALCRVLTTDTVSLEVASTNTKAISLYQRIGFRFSGEISRWYKII